MTSRTERFERLANAVPRSGNKPDEEEEHVIRFSPEEEAALLKESNDVKIQANSAFAAGKYNEAVELYTKALQTCPQYLSYERAVLKSNVAASYLKTEEWKEAVKAAGESLDLLDMAEGKKKEKKERKKSEKDKIERGSDSGTDDADGEVKDDDDDDDDEEEEADEEIISPGAAKAEDTSATAKRKADIERIRVKALLRRGKARMEMGSWSSLQGAEEDYKQLLSSMPGLSAADKKVVQRALAVLPARTKAAQEKETGEMMGKLKELGNGILRPFGLSTDNFQMVKDEKTGGYSMNFNQGGK